MRTRDFSSGRGRTTSHRLGARYTCALLLYMNFIHTSRVPLYGKGESQASTSTVTTCTILQIITLQKLRLVIWDDAILLTLPIFTVLNNIECRRAVTPSQHAVCNWDVGKSAAQADVHMYLGVIHALLFSLPGEHATALISTLSFHSLPFTMSAHTTQLLTHEQKQLSVQNLRSPCTPPSFNSFTSASLSP